MKKFIMIIFAAVMLLSMASCGKTKDDVNPDDNEPAKGADEMINDCLGKFYETLEPLFEMEAEAIKGNFVGGYFSEDETTNKNGEAGRTPVDAEDAAVTFKTVSLITEDSFSKLEDAALFHHMMNTNTLAVSSMRVASAADVESVANSFRESVGGNQIWVCGVPERYAVITIDTYVISVYGNADMVNAVKNAVTDTYATAVVVCDEAFE